MNRKRLKVVILVGVLVLGLAAPAAAQFQFDIGVNVPVVVGIEAEEDDVQNVLEYAFVVPDLKANYYFGSDAFRFGLGVRAFTAIVETLVYPTVSAEVHLDPFVLSGSFGGFALGLFGIYNNIVTANFWVPEISAAYKVNDWFHLGAGATAVFLGDGEQVFTDTFPYAVYAVMRFSLRGD